MYQARLSKKVYEPPAGADCSWATRSKIQQSRLPKAETKTQPQKTSNSSKLSFVWPPSPTQQVTHQPTGSCGAFGSQEQRLQDLREALCAQETQAAESLAQSWPKAQSQGTPLSRGPWEVEKTIGFYMVLRFYHEKLIGQFSPPNEVPKCFLKKPPWRDVMKNKGSKCGATCEPRESKRCNVAAESVLTRPQRAFCRATRWADVRWGSGVERTRRTSVVAKIVVRLRNGSNDSKGKPFSNEAFWLSVSFL